MSTNKSKSGKELEIPQSSTPDGTAQAKNLNEIELSLSSISESSSCERRRRFPVFPISRPVYDDQDHDSGEKQDTVPEHSSDENVPLFTSLQPQRVNEFQFSQPSEVLSPSRILQTQGVINEFQFSQPSEAPSPSRTLSTQRVIDESQFSQSSGVPPLSKTVRVQSPTGSLIQSPIQSPEQGLRQSPEQIPTRSITRSPSGELQVTRGSPSRAYRRIVNTTAPVSRPSRATKRFFQSSRSQDEAPSSQNEEPPRPQSEEPPRKVKKKKRVDYSLRPLYLPLGFMSIHHLGEETRAKIRDQYTLW